MALDTQPKPTQPKTTNMSAYLYFNQEHKVLLCKVHQCAITSKFIYRHFLNDHDLDLKVRQEIVNYASQFSTAEASELTYSPHKVIPVPYLTIVDAYKCQYEECHKVLGTFASMKWHCNVEHAWKAKDVDKWMETRAQTFFQRNNKRYVNWLWREII